VLFLSGLKFHSYTDIATSIGKNRAQWVSLHLFRAIEKSAREIGPTKITTDCSITAKVPAERMGFKVIKEQIVEREVKIWRILFYQGI
jgi:hypothetical protein